MSPFDRAHTTSYSTLIETMCLSCTVFEIYTYRPIVLALADRTTGCVRVFVCVSATLVVVVDAARWRAPVFLPVVDGEGQVVVQRVMGVGGGAGDVVGRVVAIDLDQPSADVTYRVVDGGR